MSSLDFDFVTILDISFTEVIKYCSTASFKGIKVVILDEADFITIQGQAALRNVIETFSRSTRFILTCNYIERVIDPIQSRCQVLKIVPPSKLDTAKHTAWVLDQEEISYETDDIKSIVNQYYPDLRKMLNTIQSSTINSKLLLDKDVLVSSNYMLSIIKELSTSKNWKNIRQIIADSGVKDFEELYRFLFDNSSKYASNREGSVAIILNEHLYQANFRIDKEINIMSAISKIIETIK